MVVRTPDLAPILKYPKLNNALAMVAGYNLRLVGRRIRPHLNPGTAGHLAGEGN